MTDTTRRHRKPPHGYAIVWRDGAYRVNHYDPAVQAWREGQTPHLYKWVAIQAAWESDAYSTAPEED